MKKLLVVLLALALIFAFAACGQQEAAVEEAPATEETEQEEELIYGTLNHNGITQEEYQDKYHDNVLFYDDLTSMLLALDKGDIDGMRLTQITADYLTALDPDAYEVESRDSKYQYSMALPEENTALLETLNTALAALEADGTLAALKEQYIDNCDPANMPAAVELPRFDGAETVRVVITGDMPPMDYMSTDGHAIGYNISLLAAIAQQAQINFELVSANSASRTLMVTSGKADVIFWCSSRVSSNHTSSADLAEGMTATTPYLEVNGARVFKAQ